MAVDLELDAEEFGALTALADRAKSPLSSSKVTDVTTTDAVRIRLTERGLLDGSGTTRQDLRPTLAAVAAATATTTLRYLALGVLVEYIAWGSPNHGPVGLSATAKHGISRLEDPAPTERVIDFIAGLVGRSPLRGLDMTLDLSIEDSVLLAAIIDVYRRRILAALGSGTGYTHIDDRVDLAQLAAALENPPASGLSVVQAIQRVCGPDASHIEGGMANAVASLARQGLVDADPSAVQLAAPCAELAQRFATITALVELANACDTGAAEVARLGFTCLQAGVADLLTVEWVERGIHIETVSADTVVGYIDCFLRRPDVARLAASPTQKVGPGPTADNSTARLASPQSAAAAPEMATGKPAWRPTHRVPECGMNAWATPDPAGIPVARIDPRVELQLLESSGDWAHILCSNGWSAWVDARAIEPLHGNQTSTPPLPVQRQQAAEIIAEQPTKADRATEDGSVAAAPTSGWRPTHVVPDGGMPAWSPGDPNERPSTRIDPFVELQLVERRGDWARIRCSNGWDAWVDGRAMEAIEEYRAPASTSGARPARSDSAADFAVRRPFETSSIHRPSSAPTSSDSAWQPTHVAPEGGMPAWATPEPNQDPVASIDARVELEVLERTGGWAHIRCSNGWSAWVDGKTIQTLRN